MSPSHVYATLSDRDALLAVCADVDIVFHCAGYAHAFSSLDENDADQHWAINFEGTRNLVEAAGQAGVKRFVFLSSVKAMGEPGNACVNESFPGDPETPYGQSKLAAEQAVLEAGRRYGMHVVNLRLAMVYGSGGRGNLERMGRLVKRRLFPPLPETGNHRSLVHVDDVVSAMRLVAGDSRANGQTFIIASQHAPSGRALFDALRQAQGLPPCHWSIPASLFWGGAKVGDWLEKAAGRRLPLDSEVVDRLLNSAWYSPARIERELGWRAQVSLVDGLSEMLMNS
jgi:nucleoside-diphosphate-sugar epimerase